MAKSKFITVEMLEDQRCLLSACIIKDIRAHRFSSRETDNTRKKFRKMKMEYYTQRNTPEMRKLKTKQETELAGLKAKHLEEQKAIVNAGL